MEIKVPLLQGFTPFVVKKGSGRAVKTENIQNEELAEELQKPIIRKFDKKGCSLLLQTIFGVLTLYLSN